MHYHVQYSNSFNDVSIDSLKVQMLHPSAGAIYYILMANTEALLHSRRDALQRLTRRRHQLYPKTASTIAIAPKLVRTRAHARVIQSGS
jgi:hypothetical protein